MRQVKSHLQRYGGDATQVPLGPDLIRAVKQPRIKHQIRVSAEAASNTRKTTEEDGTLQQPGLSKQRKILEDQVTSSKALLESAGEPISFGVKQKDLDRIQSGHVLLKKGNATLQEALGELEKLNQQMYKQAKQ
ncbi:hypothetical protein HPB48_014391 [Haemaphysalis longicornis]|uniref:Uncharacterized protein n=1 Tax=Haemaphysalis longicornis TaxID=44386 RepID=A0A9J6GQV0_HAELO|nr:hypothetical protein HPB48_014391 [Haemaphysalis longicornis]